MPQSIQIAFLVPPNLSPILMSLSDLPSELVPMLMRLTWPEYLEDRHSMYLTWVS